MILRKGPKLPLALAVILALGALAALLLSNVGTPPPAPLPNPNGYDDFLKAAALVTSDTANYSTLGHEGLLSLVSTNAEPLRLLRVGLGRQCCAPTPTLPTLVPRNGSLLGIKHLVYVLAAEGRLREMDNQPGAAARSYLDAIHLGNQMPRGGLAIDSLVGVACETIGCRGLARVVPKLGREDSRIVVAELEKVDTNRAGQAEVARNEKSFTYQQLKHCLNPIEWVNAWWSTRQMLKALESRHNIVVAHERLLAGELALRLFVLERGRAPGRTDELVPKYLSRVPQDPFTRTPLVYRPRGTNWLLYSVGPERVDHGGQATPRGSPVAWDILYDRF